MELSLVAEIDPVEVPPEFVKTTVEPPEVKLFPAASRPCKVRVMLAPELTVELDTLTTDCASEITPGVTVTVGSVDVIATPPMVPVIVVDVPLTIPVKVAE